VTPPTQEGEVRLVTRPKKGEGEGEPVELSTYGRGRIAHSFIWVRNVEKRSCSPRGEGEEGLLTHSYG